jgi:phospholipid/cholesterol/gamma-HCH transport system ATP-binding protein
MSIEMVNVHKSFGGKDVLKGFTLTIPDGETVSVIGASGSGKSVALKHIVGLLTPDEGDVWVDGENVGRLDQDSVYRLRRKVGYVFQFAALFDSMTISENVGMGLKRCRVASGSAWGLRGRSRRSPSISCMTSLRPVSIP